MLRQLSVLPKVLLGKAKEFEFMLDLKLEGLKHQFKKYSFQDFEEEIKKLQKFTQDINKTLFHPILSVGLFRMDFTNISVEKNELKKLLKFCLASAEGENKYLEHCDI